MLPLDEISIRTHDLIYPKIIKELDKLMGKNNYQINSEIYLLYCHYTVKWKDYFFRCSFACLGELNIDPWIDSIKNHVGFRSNS
jgi:hypothetical protein